MAQIVITISNTANHSDKATVTDWFGLRKRVYHSAYNDVRGLRDWFNIATGEFVGGELRDELNDAWFDTILKEGGIPFRDTSLDGRSHGL